MNRRGYPTTAGCSPMVFAPCTWSGSGGSGVMGRTQSDDLLKTAMLGAAIIFFVRCYQATFARLLGGHCRYDPTCSQYMIDAVRKYGPFRGAWRGVKRVCRCHPWGGSGYDPA